MNVVGLDLSLTSTGMARFAGGQLVEVANARSKGKRADSVYDRFLRLNRLENEVLTFAVDDLPDLVVVESPSFGSKGGSAHDRSGLWWQIVSGVLREGVALATVAPTTRAKYATGSGRADKDVVMAHVIERYVKDGTPRIVNDDQADAVALAAMGCRWLGEPVEPEGFLPEENLKAMEGAHWPVRAS